MAVTKSGFGKTGAGDAVELFTCTNSNGLVLKMLNFGATTHAIEVPDREGRLSNISLSCPNIESWENCTAYFGATVGRFCNRIANGKFNLDGQEYTLATNNGPNHLHGGVVGFNRKIWDVEPIETDETVGLKFTYTSPDGEEGYPGDLDVEATYELNNQDELKIEFRATTNQPTPVNLTNHNYWNLGGVDSGTHLDHEVMIAADRFVAVNDSLIPTGQFGDVAGGPLDFREAKTIGRDIQQIDADPIGYDHCYVINDGGESLSFAARVHDPDSGRVMEVYTTQPGIQFYTGNFLDGTTSSGGYSQHQAFCLETQHFPDSPNQPEFPSSILNPGETFLQTTVHKFSVV